MTTIAVMQPYFVPYAGYFRLFAAADLFVLLDCVQFPRRGWVHRNRLPDAGGGAKWLTLPLDKARRETPIRAMRLRGDAADLLAERMRCFPSLSGQGDHPLAGALTIGGPDLVAYLERLLEGTCAALGLPFNTIRSSSLPIASGLTGQDRILAIVRHLGGRCYLNAPGGSDLYDAHAFRRHGVELRFLEPYRGPDWSVLHRLAREDPAHLGREIRTNLECRSGDQLSPNRRVVI